MGGGVPSVARCRPGGAFPWEPTPVTVAAGPDGEPGSGRVFCGCPGELGHQEPVGQGRVWTGF